MVDSSKDQQLFEACRFGDLSAVQKLLDQGVNVNLKTHTGFTALMWVSGNGHVEIVKFLLDRGAHLDIQDNYGLTALIAASYNGKVDSARLLLRMGTDMSLKDTSGKTAKDWAEKNGHVDIVHLLDEYETKEKYELAHINMVQTAGLLDISHNAQTTTSSSFYDETLKIIVVTLLRQEHANTANIREVSNNVRAKSLSKRASWRIVVLLLVTALLFLFCCRGLNKGLLFHSDVYYQSLWLVVGKQTERRAQDTKMMRDWLKTKYSLKYKSCVKSSVCGNQYRID